MSISRKTGGMCLIQLAHGLQTDVSDKTYSVSSHVPRSLRASEMNLTSLELILRYVQLPIPTTEIRSRFCGLSAIRTGAFLGHNREVQDQRSWHRPPIAVAMIMSDITPNYSLESVRQVTVGAAPLGKDSQIRLRQLLPPGAFCTQVWGMTELSCIASMFHYPEMMKQAVSVTCFQISMQSRPPLTAGNLQITNRAPGLWTTTTKTSQISMSEASFASAAHRDKRLLRQP